MSFRKVCAGENTGIQADRIIAFSRATLVNDLMYARRVTKHFPVECFK